jgi:hypothetical protein
VNRPSSTAGTSSVTWAGLRAPPPTSTPSSDVGWTVVVLGNDDTFVAPSAETAGLIIT